MKHVFSVIFLIISYFGFSQDYQTYTINDSLSFQYKKPKLFDSFTYLPKDMADFGKSITHIQNKDALVTTVFSTFILLNADENITQNAVRFGDNLGLSQHYRYGFIGPFEVAPKNVNSAIYLSGNVFFVSVLSASFLTYGKIKHNYRALNTSSELMEGLFAVALVTQSLKRITGRQSPIASTQNGGKWQPFPNLATYQNNRANYDAYPSGHVATLMTTITILAGNYPEKKWIKPIGYTMLGVLAFDMVHSEVHWASDYPLAIAIGYIIGKNVVNRRIKRVHSNGLLGKKQKRFKTNFTFALTPEYKAIGLCLSF